MERSAGAPLKILCCRRGAFYMRPCSLRQVPRADMESAPTFCFGPSGPKLHIFYYLLSFIYYLILFLFCKDTIWKKGCWFYNQQPFCSHNLWNKSDSQALAALCTAAGDDLTAVLGSHAVQETVDAAALTLLGLESTLHFSFLLLKSRYGLFAQGFAHTLGQPCRVRLYAISTPFVKRFFAEFFVCASNNLLLQTVIHYILYYLLLKIASVVENFYFSLLRVKIFNNSGV